MHVALYWLGIKAYSLAARVVALFKPKARLFVKGRKGLQQHIHYSLIDERRPRIWMHCASLGEFEQGRPVLESLRENYPGHALVLTFFSPSGYEIRKNYNGVDYVFYLPEDSPYNAKEFLASVKPVLALFVKYDLWYFYLSGLARLNTPLLLISSIFRTDQVFFKWYGSMHRGMLQMCEHIFVQEEESRHRLHRIGIEHTSVGGDTRFDRVASAILKETPIEQVTRFSAGCKLIVAGSTWPQDEDLLKQVLSDLAETWKIIIVPHEVDKPHIVRILEQYEGEAVLWSRFEQDYYDQRILVVDTIGLLFSLYRYADVTYVGGGFNSSGIHNTLEAAVHGKPIFHGPEYKKFKEAKDLQQLGAAIPVANAAGMLKQILAWEKDRIGYNAACITSRKYVLDNTGATGVIMDYIQRKQLLKRP